MFIDKKSKDALSGLLSEVFGDEPVKIYQEVALQGMRSRKVNAKELSSNREDLDKISPFHMITKDIQLSDDKVLKDFHKDIMQTLRTKKTVEISGKKFQELLGNNNVFKNIGIAITSIMTDGVTYNKEQVDKFAVFSNKAKNTELLKTYLLLHNEKMESSAIQVLSKGINNVERPDLNKFIPKELIQITGMLQIGMALNKIATTPIDRSLGVSRFEQEKAIKGYAQAGGKHSTDFLRECKTFAREWERKHSTVLIAGLEKQKQKQMASDDLVGKVDKVMNFSEKKSNTIKSATDGLLKDLEKENNIHPDIIEKKQTRNQNIGIKRK